MGTKTDPMMKNMMMIFQIMKMTLTTATTTEIMTMRTTMMKIMTTKTMMMRIMMMKTMKMTAGAEEEETSREIIREDSHPAAAEEAPEAVQAQDRDQEDQGPEAAEEGLLHPVTDLPGEVLLL